MIYYYKNDEDVWETTTIEDFGRKYNISILEERHEDFDLFKLRLVTPEENPTASQYVAYGDIEEDEDGRPVRIGVVTALDDTVLKERVDSAKAAMKESASDLYSRAMRVISNDYPKEEREGWPEQIEAAAAVIGGATGTMLEGMASVRGLTEQEMAERVFAKREAYRHVYGAMTTNLHRLTAEIEAATTLEELEAIDLSSGWSLN